MDKILGLNEIETIGVQQLLLQVEDTVQAIQGFKILPLAISIGMINLIREHVGRCHECQTLAERFHALGQKLDETVPKPVIPPQTNQEVFDYLLEESENIRRSLEARAEQNEAKTFVERLDDELSESQKQAQTCHRMVSVFIKHCQATDQEKIDELPI